MIKSPIIVPSATKGWVSRTFDKGTATYDLTNLYSPDAEFDKYCVLDLAPPKYEPNKTYAFDKSGYNNHGTITGATWVREPSGLWVNSFDGSDDLISVANKANLTFTTESFTFILWVYSDTVSDSHYILSKGAYNTSGYALTLQNTSLRLWNFKEPVNYDFVNYFSQYQWTFIGLTRVGTAVTVYKNGVAFGSPATLGGDFVTGTNSFNWASPSGAGERWDGYQWGQRVLNGIGLSATTIAQTFNSERHLFGV